VLTDPVTIRRSYPDDRSALLRLAILDSADPITGDALVAEVDGELRAAVALSGGAAIADPFHRTADLVALLEVRASLLREPSSQMVRGPSMLDRARHAIAA
jgi:hypothetical protein